jgi:WXXGXW repeat (2 copies)
MIAMRYSLPAVLVFLSGAFALAQQPPRDSSDGVQELTRGPIHEAFAQPVVLNPQPGPTIAKAPPAPVEEQPPDEKPEGDHVVWIPGYWQYDDDANDFLWVSGIWRTIPPGQTWVPGYWKKVDQGYQWVSGFWSNGATEVEYHPEPPQSLEAGPNSDPPSQDQIWVSGCWIWRDNRYLWRPGFWMAGNPDWTWVPAHYCWTPSGYIFCDGYWDYPLYRRGLLFAPVVFRGGIRAGFIYRPRLVLDLGFLTVSLFVRPRYDHYYFGDYYAASYVRAGFYPWFSFHGSRFGYDPLYAQLDWANSRRNPNWEAQLRTAFTERRDKPQLRPPHTFAALQEWSKRPEIAAHAEHVVARPLAEAAKMTQSPVRLERIEPQKATQFKQHAVEVHKTQEDRIKWEQKIPHETVKPGAVRPPAKVTVPQSPIFNPMNRRPAQSEPKQPVQPKPVQPPGGMKPSTELPHPEDVLRPDFKRGHSPKK